MTPAMAPTITAVPCPDCGAAQNVTPGGFMPEAEPFGPVMCMVCGREFTKDEYMTGMKARRTERDNTKDRP